MKILLSLLLLGLFAGGRCSSQGQDRRQAWIERLKATPVAQMEGGLPEESFADWFAERIKPSEAGYEVKECQDTTAAAASQDRLLCVFAYTKPLVPGWNRGIQLNFVVGVFPRSARGPTEAKPVPCRFVIGWDGPSNPQMARPTRKIAKLSELKRPQPAPATRPNSE